MNDNGDAQAVWQQSDGTNLRIEERSAPGGTFAGTTVNVSPTGEDATAPQLAMDGAGDAVAAWTNRAQQINAAQHISGQEFAATESDISAGGGGDTAPSVAIDGAGDGIAGWQRSTARTSSPRRTATTRDRRSRISTSPRRRTPATR